MATGRLIKFISSEDLLYENSLEELVRAIDATGAPLAFHNWKSIDIHGLMLGASTSVPSGHTEVHSELLTRYVVAQRDNLIGGGENMLFDREKAKLLPNRFGVDGFPLPHLGDLALCIHLSSMSPLIGVGVFGSAVRRIDLEPNRARAETRLVEHLEWEILQRWCLDNGYIQNSDAPRMVRPYTEANDSSFTTLPVHPPFLTAEFEQFVNEQFATERRR